MKKSGRLVVMIMLALSFCSCENVFHNDKLDYLWRLDSVEYVDGVDLNGNPCTKEPKQGYWLSFARDLVKIDNKDNQFAAIGILTDNGDNLVFDFSMYEGLQKWNEIDDLHHEDLQSP